MNRILVSPKACAVAGQLLPHLERRSVCVTDHDLADATALAVDTCYRALVELDELGAIHATLLPTSPTATTKIRRVDLYPHHWLWAAVRSRVEDGLCLGCGHPDCACGCHDDRCSCPDGTFTDPMPTCDLGLASSLDFGRPCPLCCGVYGHAMCQYEGGAA
jgi:hypothetical protein